MDKNPIADLPASITKDHERLIKVIEQAKKEAVTTTLSTQLLSIYDKSKKLSGKFRIMSSNAFTILRLEVVSTLDESLLESELKLISEAHGWNASQEESNVELVRVLAGQVTQSTLANQLLIALSATGFDPSSVGEK